MTTHDIPRLEAFLVAPAEEVARVAPATVIFAPGGTRRSAALAGISPQSDTYAHWIREQMIAGNTMFFQHGVRHLFMNVLRPPQLAEVGYYRSRLLAWLQWGLAGPEALADYQRLGWRVRLLGTELLPELQPVAERVYTATAETQGPTLWCFVMPTYDAPLQWLLAAHANSSAPSPQAMVEALYGEALPPATMFVGFGKPMITPDLLPPLLAGDLQCYWYQQPGYLCDQSTLRRMIYDTAYTRKTWTADKSSRYTDIDAQRALWEQPKVLGLGRRTGAFWYPTDSEARR
jgi:hypothetical protein